MNSKPSNQNSPRSVAPVTRAELPADFVAVRRAIVRRDGIALRAGAVAQGCTIEAKSLRTNEWHPLALAGGAIAFAFPAERDAVLREMQEGGA